MVALLLGAWWWAAAGWGLPWPRALAVAALAGVVLLGPRMVLMERFVGAAYDLAEPICEFESWEGRRKNRWRSQLQTFGVQMDYDFSTLARAGTRKSKWISLRLEPWFSLWPQEGHVKAITVRLPSWTPVDKLIRQVLELPNGEVVVYEGGTVRQELRKVFAVEYFQIPVDQLDVTVQRRLRRVRLTFTPQPAPTPAAGGGRYTDVVNHRRG
jgi:hypothetical protein